MFLSKKGLKVELSKMEGIKFRKKEELFPAKEIVKKVQMKIAACK